MCSVLLFFNRAVSYLCMNRFVLENQMCRLLEANLVNTPYLLKPGLITKVKVTIHDVDGQYDTLTIKVLVTDNEKLSWEPYYI